MLSDKPLPASSRRVIRLAVVQPVMAPYARPVFERLAAIPGIDLKVFVLKGTLHLRTGWTVGESEAIAVEVVGARVRNVVGTTPGNRKIRGFYLPEVAAFVRQENATTFKSMSTWNSWCDLGRVRRSARRLCPIDPQSRFLGGLAFSWR